MLRPYQTEALDAVRDRTVPRGLIALPTGTGKGHIAGHLTEALKTNRILYLAHRKELIDQLAYHIERVLGWSKVGVEQGGRSSCGQPAIVASVPTLVARNCHRLRNLGMDRFDAVVVDEAHHATAESYLKIWEHFGLLDTDRNKIPSPPVNLLGLTATPSRGDNVGLNAVFDEIIYQMSLSKAITDGWLVPVYAYTIQTSTSLDGVHTRMGDYAENELAKVVSTEARNEIIFEKSQQFAKDLKTLIFCVNVEHSEGVAAFFRDKGADAKHIAGNMSTGEREAVLRWFNKTPRAVLTNCQLITEGVDIPSVECVIMGRPTKSKTLYAQCLGRGTRLARGAADYAESVRLGKDRVILLDITDNTKDIGRRAVCIGDIFGAPLPMRPLDGVEMLQEVEEQQAIVENARNGIIPDTEVVPIELFASHADLPGASMVWLDYGDSYRLMVGKHGDITIQPDTLDRWEAMFWDADAKAKSPLYQFVGKRDEIVSLAEQWVRKNRSDVLTLVDRTAKWRGGSPTDAQRTLCCRLKITIPEGATKGDVSTVISKRLKAKQQEKTTKVEAMNG